MIEGYSSWLENRVVSRFDAAIAEGNYAQQAQVVAIMTELDKEKSIAKVCHIPACAWAVFRIRAPALVMLSPGMVSPQTWSAVLLGSRAVRRVVDNVACKGAGVLCAP